MQGVRVGDGDGDGDGGGMGMGGSWDMAVERSVEEVVKYVSERVKR